MDKTSQKIRKELHEWRDTMTALLRCSDLSAKERLDIADEILLAVFCAGLTSGKNKKEKVEKYRDVIPQVENG